MILEVVVPVSDNQLTYIVVMMAIGFILFLLGGANKWPKPPTGGSAI